MNLIKSGFGYLFIALTLFSFTPVQALSLGLYGSWPVIGQQFNDQLAGYLGYSYFGTTERHWGLIKLDYNLAKFGEVQPKLGLDFWSTAPFAGSELSLNWGASAKVFPNLSVGFDLALVQINSSSSGSPTIDVLPTGNMMVNIYL